MREIRTYKNVLLLILKKSLYRFFYKPQKISFLHKNIPYFSQWESPTLVDTIVRKKISAKDDPRWKNSGAKTKAEYELWSHNTCGMACLKMILAKELGKEI
ncbi:MAG: hypothetical protein AAB553_02700 [Patescibacteria group bacterium]